MENKKGFTLIEIIIVVVILVVIAGLFTVNMINTLNKNKEQESANIVKTITSAADAYVSDNPTEIKDLYEGYGYVDITVGELIDAGFLNENLKDPDTGETISEDSVVRAKLESGDYVDFIYPVSSEELNSPYYNLEADTLTLDYSATATNWCSNSANIYNGLYTSSNKTKYSLYFVDNLTRKIKYSDFTYVFDYNNYKTDFNLVVTSCNVNPQIAGTYQIEYSFVDPNTKVERSATRTVIVQTSKKDIVSFSATINHGKDIIVGASKVPVTIVETYKDNTTSNEITVDASEISSIGYTIENLTTGTVGTRTATVSSSKNNSDGSRPANVSASYKVTDMLGELAKDSNECQTSSNGKGCYYKGTNPGNYVKYYGKLFRIYYGEMSGSNYITKLILDSSYTTAPYGQIGNCMSSCCNNGRYAYIGLGDYNVGVSKTMDSYLNDFYNSLNGSSNLKYLQSQTITSYKNAYNNYSLRTNNSGYYNGLSTTNSMKSQGISTITLVTKVGLLQLSEYKEIAGNSCNDTYLTAGNRSAFWLLDFYGARFGVGTYNYGLNAADALEYYVTANGCTAYGGATKPANSQVVTTAKYAVRPTLTLVNAKVTSGSGTSSDPYVIS